MNRVYENLVEGSVCECVWGGGEAHLGHGAGIPYLHHLIMGALRIKERRKKRRKNVDIYRIVRKIQFGLRGWLSYREVGYVSKMQVSPYHRKQRMFSCTPLYTTDIIRVPFQGQ